MKKTKFMRAALLLLVLTLITSCFVGGTFAKYTTSAEGSDSARVAKWGFTEAATIELNDLFKTAYDTTVSAQTDVIAPGTTGSDTFQFTYGGNTDVTAPEVAYTFVVSADESTCADSIKNNANIKWSLDGVLAKADDKTEGSWDALIAAINALDGNKPNDRYEPNTLPDAFTTVGTNVHTVGWEWTFSTSEDADTTDTEMGNATDLANVTLKITVTATQID